MPSTEQKPIPKARTKLLLAVVDPANLIFTSTISDDPNMAWSHLAYAWEEMPPHGAWIKERIEEGYRLACVRVVEERESKTQAVPGPPNPPRPEHRREWA